MLINRVIGRHREEVRTCLIASRGAHNDGAEWWLEHECFVDMQLTHSTPTSTNDRFFNSSNDACVQLICMILAWYLCWRNARNEWREWDRNIVAILQECAARNDRSKMKYDLFLEKSNGRFNSFYQIAFFYCWSLINRPLTSASQQLASIPTVN